MSDSAPSEPEQQRPRTRSLPATFLLIAALLALFVWRTGALGPPEVPPPADLAAPAPVVSRAEAPREGYLAPLFEAKTIDGRAVRLEELRGAPVFINFWAPWCGPCRAEMAAINRLAKQSPGDVRVLTIAVDTREADVRSFIRKYDLGSIPVIYDEDRALGALFEIAGLPTTLILEPGGRVVKRIVGARAWDHPDFGDWLARLAASRSG